MAHLNTPAGTFTCWHRPNGACLCWAVELLSVEVQRRSAEMYRRCGLVVSREQSGLATRCPFRSAGVDVVMRPWLGWRAYRATVLAMQLWSIHVCMYMRTLV